VNFQKHNPAQNKGFSLVEVMISMFILTLLALAVTKGLTFTKYTAEDSLYEVTALNLGLSIIEQMKSTSFNELSDPPLSEGKPSFRLLVDNGDEVILYLDSENVLEVPIVTEAGGERAKLLSTTLIPSITEMRDGSGLWLEVRYTFDHPRSGRTRERVVHNAITDIRSI
jgi:prepilin-type N-terminal cleavage/methylation domain-containing protein